MTQTGGCRGYTLTFTQLPGSARPAFARQPGASRDASHATRGDKDSIPLAGLGVPLGGRSHRQKAQSSGSPGREKPGPRREPGEAGSGGGGGGSAKAARIRPLRCPVSLPRCRAGRRPRSLHLVLSCLVPAPPAGAGRAGRASACAPGHHRPGPPHTLHLNKLLP